MAKKDNYEKHVITIDIARDMLRYCNCTGRDDWVQYGMALKSEFGPEGFELFDEWSQTQPDYDKSALKSTWKSFKGRGITIGFLVARALDNGYKFEKQEMSDADRKRLKDERDARRKEREKLEELEEQKQEAWRLKLSDFLMSIMDKFDIEGSSPYLENKHVAGFGCLFAHEPMVIVADEERNLCELHYGHQAMSDFFKLPESDRPKFRQIKKGVFAVPLYDVNFRVWNLQIIYASGKKSFLPGRKSGCFHVIGQIPQIGRFNICQAGGFANGAAVHMALGCPVVIAFDSGNMAPVAEAIIGQYQERISRYAICADNDLHLESQNKKNAGMEAAMKAARIVDGIVVAPVIDSEETPEPAQIDVLYDQAKEFVIESQKATTSGIQRKLRIGYNRASRIMQQLQNEGIIENQSETSPRFVVKIPGAGVSADD
jgi:putative DNA primase/helicase